MVLLRTHHRTLGVKVQTNQEGTTKKFLSTKNFPIYEILTSFILALREPLYSVIFAS